MSASTQTNNLTIAPETAPEQDGQDQQVGRRTEDLAEIIRAYNQVTERLQHSHETLQNEVLRLRRELASTNAQLQRSKRLSALGEMAAGIAHEIRNPLAAIQLYAGMIVQDLEVPPQPDQALPSARKIASAVHGLNAIVNDVLSFAREIEPAPQPLDIHAVLDRVVEAHRPAIDAAGVHVERRDRQRGELTAVHADANLLHQALLNLVRNAVDAMAGSAGERRTLTLDAQLDIQADAEPPGMTITVRDTGPGIARDNIDRIFNPFFTTRNTGTGLGLAIVHRIVDAHGGATMVHNDLSGGASGGAVFQITLPDARPRPGHFSGQDAACESPNVQTGGLGA